MKRALFILSLIASTIVANAQQNPIDSKSDPCSKTIGRPCVPPKQTTVQQAKLEAKRGIRDIKLDTPISQYNDLIEIENHGYDDIIDAIKHGSLITDDSLYFKFNYDSVKVFKRANENLLFGDVSTYSIRYLYIENNLVGVYLYFDSQWDYHKLVKVLAKLYGEPMDVFYGRSKTWFANTFQIIALWSQEDEFGGEIYIVKNDIPLPSISPD